MTAIPWNIGRQGNAVARSCVGFYCNVLAAPGAAMTLLDLDAAVNGYWRFLLQPDLTVRLEVSLAYSGGTFSGTLTSTPISAGVWTWITGDQGDGSEINLALTPRGGSPVSWRSSAASAVPPDTGYAVALGWGASLSSAAVPFFPAAAQGLMSKLWLSAGASSGSNTTALSAPTADPTSGVMAFYACRETPGAVPHLVDAGPGHYDLGLVGSLTVSEQGPYLS